MCFFGYYVRVRAHIIMKIVYRVIMVSDTEEKESKQGSAVGRKDSF